MGVPERARAGARACKGLLLARALEGALADLAVHGGPGQGRGNAAPNYGAAGAAARRGRDAVLHALVGIKAHDDSRARLQHLVLKT